MSPSLPLIPTTTQWLGPSARRGNVTRVWNIRKKLWLRIIHQKVGRPSHKIVVLLHTIFKGLALTVYLGSSLIMNSFIASFISIMMLLSADFWVVKNVSGRLLAGLRWWSVVTETGELVWRWVADVDSIKHLWFLSQDTSPGHQRSVPWPKPESPPCSGRYSLGIRPSGLFWPSFQSSSEQKDFSFRGSSFNLFLVSLSRSILYLQFHKSPPIKVYIQKKWIFPPTFSENGGSTF